MTQRRNVALAAAAGAVENVSHYLRVPKLISIRSRILALAVLGTMIPAAISLGVAYAQNRRAREEKITQELSAESSQTARAMGVWLKERIYDLRVFAGSNEVRNGLTGGATAASGARLREYLRSLHERFSDFDQLLVLDAKGRVLAMSSPQSHAISLPVDWQRTLRQQNQLLGEAYWDRVAGKGKLIVAVPVVSGDMELLGAFAAELNLHPVQAQLRSYIPDSNATVYLASTTSAVIASSREVSSGLLRTRLDPRAMLRLNAREKTAVTYAATGGSGRAVGTASRVPQVPWLVLAEIPEDAAFREVRQFRNAALMVVFALLVVVGATAYWLGFIIVRPLERLAKGAAELSLGDLNVDLPNTGGGEVGVLTAVFNRMVQRLREGRGELERLSVTDGLTGLANHRALMQRLQEESQRSMRSKRPFSVIMCDVDHFKAYNDAFGHPAGDDVLQGVATLLEESTRTVDCVARYGGEEFALLLPETEIDGAMEVAERIRQRVEREQFPERPVTVSIGVAAFPLHADRADVIIAVADAALYAAKHAGRNQVRRAEKVSAARARRADRETLPAARRQVKAKKKG